MTRLHKRCSICDRVNNEGIANLPGQYASNKQVYQKDPNNGLFLICLECYEEINELREDYTHDDMNASEEMTWMGGFKL